MPTKHMESVRVLNLDIHNLTSRELLENLEEGVVFTPNVDHLVKLQKDRDFYQAYLQADYRLCDSRIIQLFSPFFFTKKIKEQIAGSDFFPAFCEYHSQNEEVRIFLLGGTASSVKKAAFKLNTSLKRPLVVAAYSPPFGFEHDPEETNKIITAIKESGATVLAVGVGAPKQELWIYRHKEHLKEVKIFMALGKTIDFLSGESRRAPRWMQRLGLEWLFRMMQEPGRLIKRYLIQDLPFFYLAFLQKIGKYKNPWT